MAGYAYGRNGQGQAFILLYPAVGQEKEAVCRVYETDFEKLPAFINTAVPEATQDGSPTPNQAKWYGIYVHIPVFTIATIESQDAKMGPETRFSRVIDALDGPARSEQRRPASQLKPEPIERPSPPTPMVPATQAQNTAENQKVRRTAVNGENSDRCFQTAETQPVVKSAGHWKREAKTATKPLMFDTVVSRLEPWFKDANAARAFRESLFESWQLELVSFYLEALLRYAKVRQVLDGRHPIPGAHLKAKVEALNTFNRLRRDV